MFSKELQELDRNTVQYMIDIMQDEIDKQKLELSQKDEELSLKDEVLSQTLEELSLKDEALSKKDKELHMAQALTVALLKDNRIEDLQRSITDTDLKNSLLKEYQLLL